MADRDASSGTVWKIASGFVWSVGVVAIVVVCFIVLWIRFVGTPLVLPIFSSGWRAAIIYVPQVPRSSTASADPFSGLDLMYVDTSTFSNVDHANVWNLFERTRDSLGQKQSFVRDLPAGSVQKVEREDSVAIVLRYNLDCQCPKQYEVILFSVDLTTAVPSIGNYAIRKEPYPGAQQRTIQKEGGEKLAQTEF